MGSGDNKKDDGKKKEEKKPVTVVLKVQFHCEQCVKRVKKAAATIEGAQSIELDQKAGKVTIVGNVEPKKVLKKMKKTGKHFELVLPKDGEKKDKKDDDKKKDGEKKKEDDGGKKKDKEDDKKKLTITEKDDKKKLTITEKKNDGGSNKPGDYIVTRIVHNDFTYVFSDDNPNNNCSIM